jgi:hypothetical protein
MVPLVPVMMVPMMVLMTLIDSYEGVMPVHQHCLYFFLSQLGLYSYSCHDGPASSEHLIVLSWSHTKKHEEGSF